MSCRDDTIKAVDAEWRGATDIRVRIPGQSWSSSAVQHALICMASEHLIEARAVLGNNRKYEYRLKATP